MEKIRLFSVFILIISNTLGNTKGEPNFFEKHSSRDSPRKLEVGRRIDFILVEYGNFTGTLTGFKSYNPEINKAHIYLNDETNYTTNIETMDIKPYSRLKIQFNTSITILKYFFQNMGEIRKIDFSFFNSTEVNDMEFLFSGCLD